MSKKGLYRISDLLARNNYVIVFPQEPPDVKCPIKSVNIIKDDFSKEKPPKEKPPRKETRDVLDSFDFILQLNLKPCGYMRSKSCPIYRKYAPRHFIVVHFPETCPGKVIYDLLKKGLNVKTGNSAMEHFRFFGHSASQLREQTCILFNESLGEHNCLIKEFGHFENIRTVSKRAARIGLLLSSSKPVVNIHHADVHQIPDVENEDHNFTDGCGFISVKLAQRIIKELDLVNKYSYLKLGVPSTFQIRLLGCKGMLIVSPDLQNGIQIRPSMEKFKWNHIDDNTLYPLGVVDNGTGMSRPNCYATLNKQYILLLSALGVPDEVFLGKKERHYWELEHLLTSQDLQVKYLCINEHFDMAERLLAKDSQELDDETKKQLEFIRRTGLYGKRNKVTTKKKLKEFEKMALKIPIEDARNVYGVCDPTHFLEYGTCFFQPTIRGQPHVLKGMRVIVCKNPCYSPGDVRILECKEIPGCEHLVDVIVFPVMGARPHADEIAGSDLDGDKFLVCWDKDLIPPSDAEPTGYKAAPVKPKKSITYDDLIKYFSYYDHSTVGRLDKLYNEWADIRGVNSRECSMIANLFNVAIDSAKTGEKVDIPEALKSPSKLNQSGKECVWTKITKSAMTRPADIIQNASTSQLNEFSAEDMIALLESHNNPMSEYQLFRSLWKWCTVRRKISEMHSYLHLIQFSRMTHQQRQQVYFDVQDVPNVDKRMILNDLFMSKILNKADIDQLQGKGYETDAWHLSIRMEREGLSWEVFNDAIVKDCYKLILFKINMRGEEWVIGISMAGQLVLGDAVQMEPVNNVPVTMYASVHKDIQDSRKVCLTNKYEIALDGERLQIYMGGGKNRSNTFLCLMNLNDGMVGMSVALDKYQSSFPKEHNARLQREEVVAIEIFYRHKRPNMEHSLFYHPNFDEGNTDNDLTPMPQLSQPTHELDLANRAQFPRLGENPPPELSDFQQAYEKLQELRRTLQDMDRGEASVDDITPLVDLFKTSPEVRGDCAITLESQLWRHDLHLQSADTYKSIMLALLDTCRSTATVERLFENMASGGFGFSAIQLEMIMEHLMYACPNTVAALEWLQLLLIGAVPVKKDGFRTNCKSYFCHWASLITMEVVDELRQMALEVNTTEEPYVKCTVLVDKDGDTFVIYMSIEGSRQPFRATDGVALTLAMEQGGTTLYNPLYFAEVVHITGMILTLKLVWPKEDVGALMGSLSTNPDSRWRADVFPNLVTYRRLMEALRSSCAKDREEDNSWTSELLPQLLKNFHGIGSSDDNSSMINHLDDATSTPCGPNTAHTSSVDDAVTCPGDSDQTSDENLTSVHAGNLSIDVETDCVPSQPLSRIHKRENAQKELATVPGTDNSRVSDHDRHVEKITKKHRNVNESQARAIVAAMTGTITVIQGPPGTGKTRTAGVIVQEWIAASDSPVLVVAETNEGVNNVITMLLSLGMSEDDIIRAGVENKSKCEHENMLLERKCGLDGQRSQDKHTFWKFKAEAAKQVKRCKVVCTTCIGSGTSLLSNIKFRNVLVDEAAQALEPAILVAICHGAKRLCLVGDDQQLPPFSKCDMSQALKVTLFERLRDEGHPVHMLDTQYRMNPLIAAFPAETWYHGDLKNGVTRNDRPLPKGYDWPNGPIVFIDLQPQGKESLKGNSKWNATEGDEVVSIVQGIITKGGLQPRQIGVITPYKAQVEYINNKLNVDVRTVDGFQGQERDVIIFSTVRSNFDGLVGFLDDYKRMNVALTRAKSGLIVLGNKATLEKNSLWKQWITWVERQGMSFTMKRTMSDSGQRSHGSSQEGGGGRRGRGRGWGRGRGSPSAGLAPLGDQGDRGGQRRRKTGNQPSH